VVIDSTGMRHHRMVQSPSRTPVANSAASPAAERRGRLERMVKDNHRMVWRVLRRLGVHEDAIEDASQQVFLVAAERLEDIAPTSEGSFIFGIALRVSRSMRRKHSREAASADVDLSATSLPGPDELSEQRLARERLDRMLQELPLDLRCVFILFELEGLSSPQIAKLVGVPLGTVASRLRRAREQFATVVSEERASRALRQGSR
jgi:RNA polymerase sigma-70 factor, ECF subfamily